MRPHGITRGRGRERLGPHVARRSEIDPLAARALAFSSNRQRPLEKRRSLGQSNRLLEVERRIHKRRGMHLGERRAHRCPGVGRKGGEVSRLAGKPRCHRPGPRESLAGLTHVDDAGAGEAPPRPDLLQGSQFNGKRRDRRRGAGQAESMSVTKAEHRHIPAVEAIAKFSVGELRCVRSDKGGRERGVDMHLGRRRAGTRGVHPAGL